MIRQVLLALTILGLASPAVAAVPLSRATPWYRESFDRLSASGTSNVAGRTIDGLPNGWMCLTNGILIISYAACDGSDSIGGVRSYGQRGSGERAFGTVNTNLSGDHGLGVQFVNASPSQRLSHVIVGYTLEQWRNGGNSRQQVLRVGYAVSATPLDEPAIRQATLGNGGFSLTPVPELEAAGPVATMAIQALDGNLPEHRVQRQTTLVFDPPIAPGEHLLLWWSDPNEPNRDHGLAIDDLVVLGLFENPTTTSAHLVRWATPPDAYGVLASPLGRLVDVAAEPPPDAPLTDMAMPLGLLRLRLEGLDAPTSSALTLYLPTPQAFDGALRFDGTRLTDFTAAGPGALDIEQRQDQLGLGVADGDANDLEPEAGIYETAVGLVRRTGPDPAGPGSDSP